MGGVGWREISLPCQTAEQTFLHLVQTARTEHENKGLYSEPNVDYCLKRAEDDDNGKMVYRLIAKKKSEYCWVKTKAASRNKGSE